MLLNLSGLVSRMAMIMLMADGLSVRQDQKVKDSRAVSLALISLPSGIAHL